MSNTGPPRSTTCFSTSRPPATSSCSTTSPRRCPNSPTNARSGSPSRPSSSSQTIPPSWTRQAGSWCSRDKPNAAPGFCSKPCPKCRMQRKFGITLPLPTPSLATTFAQEKNFKAHSQQTPHSTKGSRRKRCSRNCRQKHAEERFPATPNHSSTGVLEMTKQQIALAVTLIFTAAATQTGCDRTSSLTEQEHIQRAKNYEASGDLKKAIIELKNAIQENPDGPQSRLLLGQVYVKASLGPAAESELRKAQQLGVKPESLTIPLGEALLLQQQFDTVLEETQASEDASPQNRAKILSLRGDAKLGLGKLDEGCELYAQSKALDTQLAAAYRGLAQCAVARGSLDQAVEQLNTALKIDGKSARNWILLGDIEVMRNNFPAAEKAYEQGVQTAPENPDTRIALAAFQIRQGKLKEAETQLGEIKKRVGPADLRWHGLEALLAFRQNRLEEADSHIGQILRAQPEHIPTLFLAGLTNYGLGRFEQATSQLNKVLAAAPGLKPARIVLSSILLKQGQVKEAETLLKPMDVEHASDPVLLSLAGQIALAKGDRKQADRYMELASRIDPKRASLSSVSLDTSSPDIHAAVRQLMMPGATSMRRAETDPVAILGLIRKKEFEKALTAIARLEQKQPNNPAVHNMRGVISLARQDWAGARRNFDKAMSLDPGYFEAAANLAQLDLRDGNPAAASERMNQLLKRNPRDARAMVVLADISARQGQEQAYRDWLEKARRAQPDLPDPALRLGRYHLAKGEPLKALDIAR